MLHADQVPPVVFPQAWQASCTSMAGDPSWAAAVTRPDGTIEIRLPYCTLIWRAQTGRLHTAYDVRDATQAVLIVGHELAHKDLGITDTDVTSGGENHAAADCAGYLLFPRVAAGLRLGATLVGKMQRFARLLGEPACTAAGL